jgi:hypothetical protein
MRGSALAAMMSATTLEMITAVAPSATSIVACPP